MLVTYEAVRLYQKMNFQINRLGSYYRDEDAYLMSIELCE